MVKINKRKLAWLTRIRPVLLFQSSTLSNCKLCGSILLPPPEVGTKIRREPVASTSSIPYTKSLRSYSTSSHLTPSPSPSSPPRPLAKNNFTSLHDLVQTIKSSPEQQAVSIIKQAMFDPGDRSNRSSFDKVFELSKRIRGKKLRDRWKSLEKMYLFAKEVKWELYDDQLRSVFEAGVKWQQVRISMISTRLKSKVEQEQEGVGGGKAFLSKVFERNPELEDIRIELMKRSDKTIEDWKIDQKTMEKYVLLKFQQAPEDQQQEIIEYERRLAASTMSEFSTPKSMLLFRTFQAGQTTVACGIIHEMINNREVLSKKLMLEIMSFGDDRREVDTYDQARTILDSTSSTSSRWNSGEEELDALLQQRLDRIDLDEWRKKHPTLAFIKWMASQPPVSLQLNWLFASLRLWELVYIAEVKSGDEHHHISYESRRLLAELITSVCRIESETTSSSTSKINRKPSSALVLSVTLATNHLTPDFLSSIANRLLLVLTTSTPAFTLSRNLYHHLRTSLSSIGETQSFTWEASTVPAFMYLLKRAVIGTLIQRDSQFALQLYFDFTASGLILPSEAWDFIWQALGTRGSTNEVSRLLNDYRQVGNIHSGIYSLILKSSVRTGKIVPTLRLLELLHERNQSDVEIDIEVYNSVLELLATSLRDRREDSLRIFQSIITARIRPTIGTWNALLASYIFRSRITMEDLDGAGKVYNSLVSAGFKPDRYSHSLLVHGFLQIAIEGKSIGPVRNFGIEAAFRTFEKAFEEGILVRGWQVGKLMEGLGQARRWEEAKGVGEKWWRLNLIGDREDRNESVEEERHVMKAAERLNRWEKRESSSTGDQEVVSEVEAEGDETYEQRFSEVSDTGDEKALSSFPLTQYSS